MDFQMEQSGACYKMSTANKNQDIKSSDTSSNDSTDSIKYFKEFWTGDSKDGSFCDGEGYHYYRMKNSLIVEAYEYYENDEGVEVVTPYPEMQLPLIQP